MIRFWPKKKLDGLTVDEIVGVRNQLIQLYLAPGEQIETAPPKGFLGVSKVKISGGTIPCFEFSNATSRHRFYLKCLPKRIPYWDCRIPYWDCNLDESEIITVGYLDPRAALPRALIKAYASHFPFLPTDNYLQNNGECIA